MEAAIAEIDENVSALCAAEDQLSIATTDAGAAYADRYVGCAPELVAEVNEANTRQATEDEEWY